MMYLLVLLQGLTLALLLLVNGAQSINPTLAGNLSLLEALWIGEHAVGALYTMRNHVDAKRSLEAAIAPPRDDVGVESAGLALLVQRIVLAKQTIYLVAGLLAGIFSPPSLAPTNQNVGAILIILVFLFGGGLLTLLSYETRRRRRKIFRLAGSTHERDRDERPSRADHEARVQEYIEEGNAREVELEAREQEHERSQQEYRSRSEGEHER